MSTSLSLNVGGRALRLLPNTRAQLDLLHHALTEGIEDSFTLPIEVPIEGNEDALGHVHLLPLAARTLRFDDAELMDHGILLHRVRLDVLGSNDTTVHLSAAVDGFVADIKGRKLPELDFGNNILVTDTHDDLRDYAKDLNTQQYPNVPMAFPMVFNPDMFGSENPSWWPGNSLWDATRAYAVNDMVLFEEGTIVRRSWGYQCTSATSAGESPATHPGKWRRTGFGVINHWDHANGEFFANTSDGNFFAMVPYFYLKWVLAKVAENMGLRAVGEFMDDPATHQVLLSNNTPVDETTITEYLHVGQTGTLVFTSAVQPLPCDDESTGPFSDASGLWDNTSFRFTPATAGYRVLRLKFHISFSTPSRPVFKIVRHSSNTVVQQATPFIFNDTNFDGTFSMLHYFAPGDVGQEFRIDVGYWGTVVPSTTLTGCTLSSWLKSTTSSVNAFGRVIEPWRHMWNVDVGSFILDVRDSFCLVVTPDRVNRTLTFDYNRHLLDLSNNPPAAFTHRLEPPLEADHQQRITGYLFTSKADADPLTMLDPAAFIGWVEQEAELTAPGAPGIWCAVRNSRRIYVSQIRFGSSVYWYPSGWHLPAVEVGAQEEPTAIEPDAAPAVMELVSSNSEEFLVPRIDEAGNSLFFGVGGKDPKQRWMYYHGMQPNVNNVDYPFASPFRYLHDATALDSDELDWNAERGLVATHWQLWANTMLQCTPVRATLRMDHPSIAGREYERVVQIDNQNYLVKKLPVEYGLPNGNIIARDAELLKLP